MRTLLFTLEYPPFRGGVANYYGNIIKYWPNKNEIFLLNNQGNLISNKLPFLKWLPSIFALKKSIEKDNIDYVLVGHILPLGTATFILSWFVKFKYTAIIHGTDYSFSQRSAWKRIITKMILKKSDKIICNNNYLAGIVQKIYGDKVFAVNPGIEKNVPTDRKIIENLKQKHGLAQKFLLLSVGRLVKRKGFSRIISLMPTLNKQVPGLVYVIIGDGPEYDYTKIQIEKEKLDNVVLLKNAGDRERNAWLDLCDVFIMVAEDIRGDYEGFGIVYLEANKAGKPVVAGDSGGVRDAVINNETGLLVDPNSDDEIINAILKLYSNKELRIDLGLKGKNRALIQFEWSRQINNFYSILTNEKKI